MSTADPWFNDCLRSDQLDQPTIARLSDRLRRAARTWSGLGIERRLSVIARCAEILRADPEGMAADYMADGSSKKLAERNRWHILGADRAKLTAIARELTRRVVDADFQDRGEIIARRPDGVVLIIAPTQAPGVALITLLEILLSGNVVVSRIAYEHPATRRVATALRTALDEHGMTIPLFELIVGSTRAVLESVGVSSAVDTIVFYGGYETGSAVFARGTANGKKVILELEGNDSIVAWQDADVDAVVKSAADVFNISGAACVSPRRVLCHTSVYQPITSRLADLARASARSIANDPEAGLLVPLKSPEYADEVRTLYAAHGRIVAGGEFLGPLDEPTETVSAYLAPMVATTDSHTFLSVQPQPLLARELLAPVSMTIDCGVELDTFIEILRRNEFDNRVSVWTRDPKVVRAVIEAVPGTGTVAFNATHMENAIFGGQSGGRRRTGGPFGESIMFWQKTTSLQTIRCSGTTDIVLETLGARSLHGTILL